MFTVEGIYFLVRRFRVMSAFTMTADSTVDRFTSRYSSTYNDQFIQILLYICLSVCLSVYFCVSESVFLQCESKNPPPAVF